jgi:retron-type reverse transcriptase
MIEPKPVGSVARPKPIKILSKDNLRAAWDISRDSTAHAGSAGIDKESAKQFASNLDENLDEIRKRLLTGTYRFSRLRPVFIQKPN